MQLFEPLLLNENETFINTGSTNIEIAYIEQGVMKATLNNSATDEKIQYFIGAEHFVSEPTLLYKQQPAIYSIKAATKVSLMVCPANRLYSIAKHIKNLDLLIKTISEMELADIIAQKNMINFNNAIDKLKYFENAYPGLAAKVKDYEIASFLGITRYTFCRIKNKIAKE
ncbi:MAG TPA: hypothetical protein PLS94_07460 [Prolixibacteraceae bacterium]|nr:hypothetical protein [Prolixibacteraceae bacterium]HPR59918.1 hypothetical protein [Prolixibacteraceae bacterium]